MLDPSVGTGSVLGRVAGEWGEKGAGTTRSGFCRQGSKGEAKSPARGEMRDQEWVCKTRVGLGRDGRNREMGSCDTAKCTRGTKIWGRILPRETE